MSEAERTIETPDEPDGADTSDVTDGTDETADVAGDDGAEENEAGEGRGKRRILVLAGVAAFAYVLDLVTKIMVVEWLEHEEPIEVLGEWLRFEAVRNGGAAFGIGEALTVVFTCIAAAVIAVIVRLARKLYSTPWAIALGLLLGGALGNLTDRVLRAPGALEGHVVDFIAPKYFAVFNLADSAIVCGGILIVLLSFRGLDPDGTVHRD
ncbi:signal peptidase II [Streptomyces litchfieldiae]|uniref:Lipoprotein signal peptidase n=1 Tax=Streptomyces litchfieldiae TaxID=3075543 RepID=A0ABU2N096_9ACTN|nr:signal peptidase II [Streptomyces sp. DSM 44938]MDT0346508.1 signal peptidase II [Streptomyces sp. DSM 44938]